MYTKSWNMKMKYRFCFAVLTIVGMTLSQSVVAGCDKISTVCLVFNNGTESTEACEITMCANIHEYIVDWNLSNGGAVSERMVQDSHVIKVDNNDGISIPFSILKDNLTCYASRETGIVYCAKGI
ncbi:hypothetical protein [Photobacterium nomapromontoriensis]|uniref:hypothetical protein n=1 Tax=Photobacterium nomapromontoriensis TaxID=2910237 RepID=UPI003D127972